ncbi:MAG: hypothetical protein IJU02_07435 [Lachnospiraceae bacterium]|nr:hypothetical protein [Lachnospiraceae bacterium]
MLEDNINKINSIIDKIFKNALEAACVISDYFGEELVDVDIKREILTQSFINSNFTDTFFNGYDESRFYEHEESFINVVRASPGRYVEVLVRFPKVTVTNENDKSIEIRELYVKININYDGSLLDYFKMRRSEFTISQWVSQYSHSHLSSDILNWQRPCFGEGPIRTTQERLQSTCNIDVWGLFCYELSKYVTVESLSGGPYKMLEKVGVGDRVDTNNIGYYYYHIPTHQRIVDRFLIFCLKNININIGFSNNQFVLGESCTQYMIKITNLFIDWCNKEYKSSRMSGSYENLISLGFFSNYIISGNAIYTQAFLNKIEDIREKAGTVLFKFKGKDIALTFTDLNNVEEVTNLTPLLNLEVAGYILYTILLIINYNYGRESGIGKEHYLF